MSLPLFGNEEILPTPMGIKYSIRSHLPFNNPYALNFHCSSHICFSPDIFFVFLLSPSPGGCFRIWVLSFLSFTLLISICVLLLISRNFMGMTLLSTLILTALLQRNSSFFFRYNVPFTSLALNMAKFSAPFRPIKHQPGRNY